MNIFASKDKEESLLHPLLKSKEKFEKLFNNRVLLLSGPTSVGKTQIALFLAEKLNGEIISADSVQVYTGMDIGTAKVSLKDRMRIPHHLIDIRHIQESFNVIDFYYETKQLCKAILKRNKVPIIVGGTGFYFSVFLSGPPLGPASIPDLRLQLELEKEKYGLECLFQRLQELDPEYACNITSRDHHKIIRALEIIIITGKKVSEHKWERQQVANSNFSSCAWFIYEPKDLLFKKIEQRCHLMMEQGFLDEVRYLMTSGILCNSTAARAIGYKQWLSFLIEGEPKEEFNSYFEQFVRASKKYVKRQFTWFKKQPIFKWLNIHGLSLEEVAELISKDFLFKS